MNLPFLSSVESQQGKNYFLICKFLAKIYEEIPEPVLELVITIYFMNLKELVFLRLVVCQLLHLLLLEILGIVEERSLVCCSLQGHKE